MRALWALVAILAIIILAPAAWNTLKASNIALRSPIVVAPAAAAATSSQVGGSTRIIPPSSSKTDTGSPVVSDRPLKGNIDIGISGPVSDGIARSGDFDFSLDGGLTWQAPYEEESDPDNIGQILVFPNGGYIRAANAGSCFNADQVPAVTARMMTDGCEQGCKNVNIWYK